MEEKKKFTKNQRKWMLIVLWGDGIALGMILGFMIGRVI